MVKPIFLKYSREHFPAVKKDLNSVVKNIDTINSVFQRDNTRVSKPLSIFTPIPQGAGIAADGLQSVPIIKQGKFIDIESERKAKERNKILSNAVLETVPVFGKTPEITERVKSKDYPGATIVASQLALDFPNLIDDAVDAVDQLDKTIKTKICGDGYKYMYKKAYDFKKAQHPFSYFRGTLLQDYVNPYSSKCPSPKLGEWLLDKDITVWDTKLGKQFGKVFKIKESKIRTSIKDTRSTDYNKVNVRARVFDSPSKLGKFTARAMTRTPVIGLAVSAAIETCQVVNAIKNGEKPDKAIVKGALRFTSGTAITAICGTVGSFFGPVGSLIGLGIGAGLSYLVSKAIK